MQNKQTCSSIPGSQLKVGDSYRLTKQITRQDVEAFCHLSWDFNPIHLDPEYAKKTPFKKQIVHGVLVGSLISSVLGCHMPGTGTIYLEQKYEFMHPVFFDDTITAEVIVVELMPKKKFTIARLSTQCMNQNGDVVIKGEAKVIPPQG